MPIGTQDVDGGLVEVDVTPLERAKRVVRTRRDALPIREGEESRRIARRSLAWMPMTSIAKMPQVEPARKTAMMEARTRIICDHSSRKARVRWGRFGRSVPRCEKRVRLTRGTGSLHDWTCS
ncbi:hypothetical protein GCM10009727_32100 [Actinomadura napierensis]|uniref:Uncharacterized protein n=1 Tax=Actinomadura napierensis TaxID=267854 RepID=A0ABN2Z592_9ACTN